LAKKGSDVAARMNAATIGIGSGTFLPMVVAA
jgi:hypothetical protein